MCMGVHCLCIYVHVGYPTCLLHVQVTRQLTLRSNFLQSLVVKLTASSGRGHTGSPGHIHTFNHGKAATRTCI